MNSKNYIFMLNTIDANCFKVRTFDITVKVFDLTGASINSPNLDILQDRSMLLRELAVFASMRVVRILPVISIAIS